MKKKKINGIVSVLCSGIPLAIILCIAVFCLVSSVGSFDENSAGAIWWLLVIAIWRVGPAMLATSPISIIFGIISIIKKEDIKFAIFGFVFSAIPIIFALLIFCI